MGRSHSHPIQEAELCSISFPSFFVRHTSLDSSGRSLSPPTTNSVRIQRSSRPYSEDLQRDVLLLGEKSSIIYEDTENLQMVLHDKEDKYFLMRFYNSTEYCEIKNQVKIKALALWQYTNYCVLCQRKFNLIRRQHHCRMCGKSICKQCYEYFKIPSIQVSRPQKVCISCKARCIDKQVRKKTYAKHWEEVLRNKL
jgi:hypothetical protein